LEIMSELGAGLLVALGMLAAGPATDGRPLRVTVPFVAANEIDMSDLVARLAGATGLDVARPPGVVTLPVNGLAGTLSRKMLEESLGNEVSLAVQGQGLVVTIDPALLAPGRRDEWARRVADLATRTDREARRRLKYGLHARKSYRPNDPARPTVCLIHGVNSSSGGFVHTIPPIEESGFGVVVYDFPYNRRLEDSCRKFARDWARFRDETGEKRPWALVGHSMGALIARDYVEGPSYAGDVSTLIMIAPVNQGSHLAQTQKLLQLTDTLQAVNGRKTSDALAHLGDGLGEAAADMLPGSAFLKSLNARPRRDGVAYHILAGDLAFLSAAARRQIDERVAVARRQGGIIGGLVRLAAGSGDELSDRLDEVTDGAGDGCVSVARTKLAGVSDHVVMHANHAELIRAPLLFRDPGPVACMPYLLRWLGKPEPGPHD
jgi:pimeloyl-ACP methyl ester carboxylesterase